MAFYYAQLNSDQICYAILQTYAAIAQPNMIAIPSYTESYLGKRWTGSTWEDITEPPVS
jgi:hypothetical protein